MKRWSKGFIQRVVFSDEERAYIHGNIRGDIKNYMYSEIHHTFSEDLLHTLKFGVWCAMSAQRTRVFKRNFK
jgi:hypothetical protein